MIHGSYTSLKLYFKDSNDAFIQAELIFRRELEPENIIVANHLFETLDDPVGTIEDLFVSFIIAIIILHKLSFVLLVCELLSSDKIIVRIERAYTDGYKKVLTSHQPNSSNCIDIAIYNILCSCLLYHYC